MKKIKKILALTLLATLGLSLSACGKSTGNADDANKLTIGATTVPHAEILEHLKPEMEKEGLKVDIKTFDDYTQLNHVLNSGDIDANFFQHVPYLDSFCRDHKMKLVSIGGVHLEPLGLYSAKYKTLDEIPNGSKVLIPNDPTNGGRALLLLQSKGLIKLSSGTSNLEPTEKDIVENKKEIKFVPVQAALISKAYKDEAAGVINSNFAISAKIDLSTAIVKEDKDSPYVNVVAVKEENKDKEKFKKLMKVLHSDKSKKFIEEKYKNEVIAAFTDK